MTQDEIIEMARQAGMELDDSFVLEEEQIWYFCKENFIAFAKLVAAKEREIWRNAAIRVGENLATCGPVGYYDFTAQQWLNWALDATTKMQNDYMNLGACGEREACAKRAEIALLGTLKTTSDRVLKAIRARGQE